MILVIILPAIVLFPILFGKLLDLLKQRKISSTMFTASCVIPFLVVWPYVRKTSSEQESNPEEERCIKEILDMEETLFKSNDKEMRWPIVQLYRNIFVVIIDTFVLSPVFKNLWYSSLFLAFHAHDWYRVPYRHNYLNQLQKFSSAALFLVNICSAPSSMSSVGDILALPGMPYALLVLEYLEITVYVLVPITLPAWKVWMHFHKKKEIYQNSG